MNRIDNLVIEKLFGYYDYNLKKDNPNKESSKLLILYGDNGTGKTTILKSIFYLLSPARGMGHKSALARTKFKTFSVYFSDGIIITAYRENNEIVGSYRIKVQSSEDTTLHNVFFEADPSEDYKVLVKPLEVENELAFDKFIQFLCEREILVFQLDEDRDLLRTDEDRLNDANSISPEEYYSLMMRNKRMKKETAAAVEEFHLIERTVNRLTKWLQDQNLLSSQKGENDANEIYREIIKNLVSSVVPEERNQKDSISKALSDLQKINNKSQQYSKYGLLSNFDFIEFINIINSTTYEKQLIIFNILEPYIESLNAKINALENLYQTIDKFTSSLNSDFLKNKQIKFNINTGFSILMNDSRDPIPFQLLSSGEKQLILLFSNILLTSDKASLFIIDEPEISLNIKWQRRFLETLLQLNEKSGTQYIVSTHSMEILSSNLDNVFQLTN